MDAQNIEVPTDTNGLGMLFCTGCDEPLGRQDRARPHTVLDCIVTLNNRLNELRWRNAVDGEPPDGI